jgi:hypothetical protein
MPRILFLSAAAKPAPHHLVASPALLSQCRGSWASTTTLSNAPSSLSGVDAVARKPCAQWSPPGQYRSPCPQRRGSVCCRTLARRRHWTLSRSRISAARSAHLASVSRPGQQSRPPKSSGPRHFETEPGSIPVGTLWRPVRHGACPAAGEPAVLFLPANTARLLVGISVGVGNNQ